MPRGCGAGEGQRDGSGREARHDLSGHVAPLSRPGLTAGPPSPAEGGGRSQARRNPRHDARRHLVQPGQRRRRRREL
ncbi:hypothetical protein FV228_20185 [Methylobacterium sp. WL18]|nr:hypothetical protein FV233_12745 [Methylobacterium sp. WL7]TXN61932.1 hypothetical protein FV228_20185 [Methylobacterium sp. WL18]